MKHRLWPRNTASALMFEGESESDDRYKRQFEGIHQASC